MEDDQLSDVRSRYIGFIFQSYNLLAQYTVVENIEVPLLYQGIRLGEATQGRCIQLAELVVGPGEHSGRQHREGPIPGLAKQMRALLPKLSGGGIVLRVGRSVAKVEKGVRCPQSSPN